MATARLRQWRNRCVSDGYEPGSTFKLITLASALDSGRVTLNDTFYCGGKADTVDHVVPRSRGGEHTWENCVAACSACNHRKADKLLTELGWTLRLVPTSPKGQHWRLLCNVKELDPAWVRYLGEGAA